MADFSHLKTTKKLVANYTFWNVVGEPTITVRFAGESNKPYFNEKLRRAEQLQKRKAKLSVELIKENRDRDYDLYPKHVVTDLNPIPSADKDAQLVGVVDAAGAKVVMSLENAKGFLRAIGDAEFDLLREFCSEEYNFRDVADAVETAGNSPTA